MALRAMYKGFKKVLAPLIINRPGVLAIDQDALDTELNKIYFTRSEQAELGAVNIFNNSATTATDNGVTFTVADDKTIATSGASTNTNNYSFLTVGDVKVTAGKKYVLSGCPSGGGAQKYELYGIPYNAGGSSTADPWIQDFGDGVEFTVPSGVVSYKIYIRCYYNISVSDKVWKPMVTTDKNTPYAPPAMTNKELTDAVATLNGSASDQKTAINAIITAATGAADFAAFKTAMGAITPVTRSIQITPETREEITEPVEEVKKTSTRKKSTAKADTEKEGDK